MARILIAIVFMGVAAAGVTALDYLGTVEGKTFYSDHTNTYTWEASIAFCRVNQMRQALVSTPGQIAFLATKFDILGPTYYWTADVDMNARRALAFHCSSPTSCGLVSTDISWNYWSLCEV